MSEGIANADVSEIEVTPEMIEAGSAVLLMYDPTEDAATEWVGEIYRAMVAVRKPPAP